MKYPSHNVLTHQCEVGSANYSDCAPPPLKIMVNVSRGQHRKEKGQLLRPTMSKDRGWQHDYRPGWSGIAKSLRYISWFYANP
jgi:hypothetical protein